MERASSLQKLATPIPTGYLLQQVQEKDNGGC